MTFWIFEFSTGIYVRRIVFLMFIVADIVKKLPTFHGNSMYIAVCITILYLHLLLNLIQTVQQFSVSIFKTQIIIINSSKICAPQMLSSFH
jgi:cell division ATPase FtsA